MTKSDLNSIVEYLEETYHPHSIILYGSLARGEENSASDVDIAIFTDGVESEKRDARVLHGLYLDAFVYPTKALSSVDESFLKFRSGQILKDKKNLCKDFLHRVDEFFQKGPKPFSREEIQVKKMWALKMLERAKVTDVEGDYRRVWLLTALLEDFFVVRGEWFLGPKESFKKLRVEHPQLFSLYEKAVKSNASLKDVEELARAVIDSMDKALQRLG